MKKSELIYVQIADNIEHQIQHEVLKVGDKLPSLRTICLERGVSLSSASQAYLELESRGLIESRPRCGYYVSYAHKHTLKVPATTQPQLTSAAEDVEEIINTINNNASKANIFLSSGVPALELLPVAKLNKGMVHAIRSLPDSGIHYERNGNARLQTTDSATEFYYGAVKLKEEDIITTSGGMDALTFCMLSLAKRGDTIAVESPVFYGILLTAKNMGLKVMELPTNAVSGVDLDALERAMKKNKIKICLLVSNF